MINPFPHFVKQNNHDQGNELSERVVQMQECSHPCLDYCLQHSHNGQSYLITPILPTTLFDIMQNNINLDDTTKQIIAIGIAFGLKYLHQKDYVHYNLTLDAIKLDEDNHPYISDFGQTFKENVDRKWCAPEQQTDEQLGTDEMKKANIFSFGLILLWLACGYSYPSGKPIPRSKKAELVADVESKYSGKIPKCWGDIKNIIINCLNANPTDRYDFNTICDLLYRTFMTNSAIKVDQRLFNYFKLIEADEQLYRHNHNRMPLFLVSSHQTDEQTNINRNIYHSLQDHQAAGENLIKVFVLVNGSPQSGKTHFLRTLTGNNLFFSGHDGASETQGILIDGPYSHNELIERVYDVDFQNQLQNIQFRNSYQFYFLDSQGINDRQDPKLEQIYKYLSFYGVESALTITFCNYNISENAFAPILNVTRRAQTIIAEETIQSLDMKKNLMLVWGSDAFDNSGLSFNDILTFQRHFSTAFCRQKPVLGRLYQEDKINVCPLGNFKANVNLYNHSVWYALYQILQMIQEQENFLREPRTNLVPRSQFQILADKIIDSPFDDYVKTIGIPDEQTNYISNSNGLPELIRKVLIYCHKSVIAIGNLIANAINDLAKNQQEFPLEQAINDIVDEVCKEYLTFYLASLPIPLNDIKQYAFEVHEDVKVFDLEYWQEIIKASNRKKGKCTSFFATSIALDSVKVITALGFIPRILNTMVSFIPLVSGIANCVLNGSSIIMDIVRLYHEINERFGQYQISMFPFIWKKNHYQKPQLYDNFEANFLRSSQTTLVFVKPSNDQGSLCLFQSLTGIKPEESELNSPILSWKNVPIKPILDRFARHHQTLETSIKAKKIDILYIIDIQNRENLIYNLVEQIEDKNNIIFVSALMQGQTLPTFFSNFPTRLYLFYISESIFNYSVVNHASYSAYLNNRNERNYIHHELNPSVIVLPILSKDYQFENSGPVCWALIKFGCLYILEEKTITKLVNVNQ